MNKRKTIKIIAVALGGLIIVALVVGGIIYFNSKNDSKTINKTALNNNENDGYTEVEAEMYVSIPGNLELNDDEVAQAVGPYVATDTLIKILAINKKTGWCKVEYVDNNNEASYYFIKLSALSTKNTAGEETESALDNEIIKKVEENVKKEANNTQGNNEQSTVAPGSTGQSTTTSGSTNAPANNTSTTTSPTTQQTTTSAPISYGASGWADDVATQVFNLRKISDTNIHNVHIDFEGVPYFRDEHYFFIQDLCNQFVNGTLNADQVVNTILTTKFTYFSSFYEYDVQRAPLEVKAAKLTITGKDPNVIANQVRNYNVSTKFLFIKVYYNGETNTSTVWVVDTSVPSM